MFEVTTLYACLNMPLFGTIYDITSSLGEKNHAMLSFYLLVIQILKGTCSKLQYDTINNSVLYF